MAARADTTERGCRSTTTPGRRNATDSMAFGVDRALLPLRAMSKPVPEVLFAFEPPDLVVASFAGHCGRHEVQLLRGRLEDDLARIAENPTYPPRPHVIVRVTNRTQASRRAQREAADVLSVYTRLCGSWAIVIEGTGFWAASARTVASSILTTARLDCPVHVEDTVRGGLARLRAHGCAAAESTFGVAALRAPSRSTPTTRAQSAVEASLPHLRASSRQDPASRESANGLTQLVPLSGHLTAAALQTALDALPRDTRRVLIDAREMTGYDREARDLLVGWAAENGWRLEKVGVLTTNPFWRLVVTGMAAASRQNMKAFATRDEADTWLRTR